MMGFDETDLLHLAETAGFVNITARLELSSTDRPPFHGVSWPQLMKISPNPNAPTFGEAITQALMLLRSPVSRTTYDLWLIRERAVGFEEPTSISPPKTPDPEPVSPTDIN